MKTEIFKQILPVAAMLLATAGAFSTQAVERNSAAAVNHQGFIRSNDQGTVCNLSLMCSDIQGDLCVVGTTQLWGKDDIGRCVVPRYKAQP